MQYIEIREETVVRKIYRFYYDELEEKAEAIEEFYESGWISGSEFWEDELMEVVETNLYDDNGSWLDEEDAEEIRETLEPYSIYHHE